MTTDEQTEKAVISAILLAAHANVLRAVSAQEGVRPIHFLNQPCRGIYEAMLAVEEHGADPDSVAVVAELDRRGQKHLIATVHGLALTAPGAGNIRAYARLVREAATWRGQRDSAERMMNAASLRDPVAWGRAEDELLAPAGVGRTLLPDARREAITRGDGEADEMFALPWRELSRLLGGGLARGSVTLLGGWTSHGKSVIADQVAAHVAKTRRVHLYVNEMTIRERNKRDQARESGVPFGRVYSGNLEEGDEQRLAAATQHILVGITDASGWPIHDIGRHARAYGFDLVVIDILHLIEHRDEADMRVISQALNTFARQADCAVLATVHLNEKRITTGFRPQPATGDIRQSGMLKNDAANVVFIWREQEEGMDDLYAVRDEGWLYVAKARNGRLGGVRVRFNADRMRFDTRLEIAA